MTSTKSLPSYIDVDGFLIPGSFLPAAYKSALAYKPRSDDLFVVTFPKCGTTWTQQIVLLIYNKGVSVSNFMEFNMLSPFLELSGVEAAEQMKRPGVIKYHVPYSMTPQSPEAKYIYVVRNPKDTLVSFYHHTTTPVYEWLHGEFDVFYELFLKGETDWGDYFDHVMSWYEHRNDPNVLFLTYEELKRDTRNTVKKIAKFMGPQYASMLDEDEEVLENVLKYSSVDFMKGVFNKFEESIAENYSEEFMKNDMVPPGVKHFMKFMVDQKNTSDKKFGFVRKGIIGDWKNVLSDEQARRLDEKIEKRLKGTELLKYWKSIECI